MEQWAAGHHRRRGGHAAAPGRSHGHRRDRGPGTAVAARVGSVGVAEHFAVHAGLALGQVRREEQLRTALGTRTIIGTAVGVVMERYGLSQAEAFAYLMRQSSPQNQKLRLVAKDLVEDTEQAAREKRWPESREQ